MSHDQKSCDIYRKFKWHKQASTTPELQPHYTMRPLSVDKLNMVISRLNSGQTTCQISSTFGVSSGTISKKNFPGLPKSSGGHPVKLSPANICHTTTLITSEKAETAVQVSKALQTSTTKPIIAQKVCRHLGATGVKAVVKRKSHFCHRSMRRGEWSLKSGTKIEF